jgi:hypothetical protein
LAHSPACWHSAAAAAKAGTGSSMKQENFNTLLVVLC